MDRRWRGVLLAYVVFAALAADYWLVEAPRTARSEAQPARPRLLAIEPADVREVRLSRSGRSIVSQRRNEQWDVLEPAGAAIPPDLIGAFASALAEAEEIARVGRADDAAFGFGQGATRVELRGASGAPIVITIGGTNPTRTAVYARRQDAPDVVLIGRNIRYYEDLIFQALAAERVPAAEKSAPVG